MFSQIDKKNFIKNSRRDNESVVLPRLGGATENFNKIFLPEGNLDFVQSLRYASSEYDYTFSSVGLDLGQNQRFQLSKNI